jgi:amidase
MTLYADFKPHEDATVVTRLQDAGAIILGKLQLTESAYADHHPEITPPKNPWSADHWPGASSSGSGVATAAGLCYGSLGSDTGGSIRFPSAAQGLTGLKPSWGRVSRYGVFELAATLDHVGPMTRSAKDAAAMLAAIAGPDPKDPTAFQDAVPDYLATIAGGVAGLRIGTDPAWTSGSADAETQAVVAAALEVFKGLGAEIVEVSFPDIRQAVQDWFPLCGVETAVAHARTFPAQRESYGPALAGLIELGRSLSGLDFQRIILRREDLRGRVNALLTEIDLLLIPAMGFAAPSLAKMGTLGTDEALMNSLLGFTCPFDMTGHPSLTMPGGFTPAGLPVTFQIIGAHKAEGLLCQAGHAFQQATDWHQRHPDLG